MTENAANSEWQPVWRRWSWVIALQVILLAILAVDRIPQLRGYAPWPPEWQWTYLPNFNLTFVILMALLGAGIAWAGWCIDRAKARSARIGLFSLLLILSVGWQLSAIALRPYGFGVSISTRTTVTFLEDFFHASQAIESPGQAFVDYDLLVEEHNALRVATHPPGMVWFYSLATNIAESTGWGGFVRGLFSQDQLVREVSRAETFSIFAGIVLKLLGGVLALIGVWLLMSALYTESEASLAGRAAALVALVPAVSLFTACIDQLIMGFAVLCAGLLFFSTTGPRRRWLASLSGLCIFLISMLAYQVIAIGFLIGVSFLLYVYTRWPDRKWEMLFPRFLVMAIVPLALWQFLKIFSGYDFLEELRTGIAAHEEGGIHANRSRIPWIFWNAWDILFFLGLAWIPVWFSPGAWKPKLASPLLLTYIAMFLLITFADGVRGETARIMLFGFPLLACGLLHRNEWILEGKDFRIFASLLTIQTIVFASVLHLF